MLVDAKAVKYRYPDGVLALDGIDFHLLEGETVALLGRNGSGKTTFLHALLGLVMAEGTIYVCGRRVDKHSVPFIRSKAGLLFQDPDDQLFLPTVAEDVSFGPQNMELPSEEVAQRVDSALRQVDMIHAATRAPQRLSAGEKRRVALAGLLAMSPEILLLDEPATYLDPPGKTALLEELITLPQAKILVTHDIDLAEQIAHRAVFFEAGRVAGEGGVREVVERFNWCSSRAAEQPARKKRETNPIHK